MFVLGHVERFHFLCAESNASKASFSGQLQSFNALQRNNQLMNKITNE